ncbi:MAG: superoxide dismutase family protein [Alphaproteobacteria bacterium]|nr:superoxide dismutase family protein [Alphaproteobacteria bacterium]MDE2110059.1 superoxide dismutase family protein [Alphaproteobacteria bacterium]MDE2492990.1 superoxide dismutase family protein [Alphaproteobacteria bacterium]
MNNSTRVAIAFVMAAGLVAATAAPRAHAVAKLIGLNGKPIGLATFQQTPRGVLIEIDARGLPPGAHAMMIHTTASCDPKTSFTSAGPVFSFEQAKPHGYLATGGPRAGDLPHQFAASDGTLHASTLTNAFSLGNGKKSIFDRDGASLIIHAEADDYTSQPDGNSGRRIACGTVIRTVAPGMRKGASRRMHK